MPTTNPRVNTVLEPQLYEAVEFLAKKQGVSLSQKVRDLVKEALEIVEDEGLEALAASRAKDIGNPRVKWVSHDEVKRRFKIR